MQVEVWAQLVLRDTDARAIQAFLVDECGARPRALVRRMHLTVYHARRLLDGVEEREVSVTVEVPAVDTRFMVLAPGGENPRPELVPRDRKIGIRVRWQSAARRRIEEFRSEFFPKETRRVLGSRRPSDNRRNAFGARHFQPHVTLLRPGNALPRNLTEVGAKFRIAFSKLTFDRYLVEVVRREQKSSM